MKGTYQVLSISVIAMMILSSSTILGGVLAANTPVPIVSDTSRNIIIPLTRLDLETAYRPYLRTENILVGLFTGSTWLKVPAQIIALGQNQTAPPNNPNNATTHAIPVSVASSQDPYYDLSLPRAVEFKVPYMQSAPATTNATWWNDALSNNLSHRTQIVLQNTNNQQEEVVYLYYTNDLQNIFNHNPQDSLVNPLGTDTSSNTTTMLATVTSINKQNTNQYLFVRSQKSQTSIQPSQLNRARFKNAQIQSSSSDPTSYDIAKFHDSYIFQDTGYDTITQYRSLPSSSELQDSTTTIYLYISGSTTTDTYNRLLTVTLNGKDIGLNNVEVYSSSGFSYILSICSLGCNIPLNYLSSSDTPTYPGNNYITVTLTTYVGNWMINTYITSSLNEPTTNNLVIASASLGNKDYPYYMQDTGYAQKSFALNIPRGVVSGTISLSFVDVSDPNGRDIYVYVDGQPLAGWDPYIPEIIESTSTTGNIDISNLLFFQKSITVTIEITTWTGLWEVYGEFSTSSARLDPYTDSSAVWTSDPTGYITQSYNIIVPTICGYNTGNAYGGVVSNYVNAMRTSDNVLNMGFGYALDDNSWNYISQFIYNNCYNGIWGAVGSSLENLIVSVDLHLTSTSFTTNSIYVVNYNDGASTGGADDGTGDGVAIAQTSIDTFALLAALAGQGEIATGAAVASGILTVLKDLSLFTSASSTSTDGASPVIGSASTYADITLNNILAEPTNSLDGLDLCCHLYTTNAQTLLERDATFNFDQQAPYADATYTLTFSFKLSAGINYATAFGLGYSYYVDTLYSSSTSISFTLPTYQA